MALVLEQNNTYGSAMCHVGCCNFLIQYSKCSCRHTREEYQLLHIANARREVWTLQSLMTSCRRYSIECNKFYHNFLKVSLSAKTKSHIVIWLCHLLELQCTSKKSVPGHISWQKIYFALVKEKCKQSYKELGQNLIQSLQKNNNRQIRPRKVENKSKVVMHAFTEIQLHQFVLVIFILNNHKFDSNI